MTQRRMPYIEVVDFYGIDKVRYICPNCKILIRKYDYIAFDRCKYCGCPINKTSKTMLRVYQSLDKDLYNHFIEEIKKGR